MNRLLAFVVALWLGIDTCPAPVDFDGADDRITITNDTLYQETGFTFSAWVLTDTISGAAVIYGDFANNLTDYVYIGRNAGVFRVRIQDSGSSRLNVNTLYNISTAGKIGKWIHIAYSDTGGSGTFYIDGVADSATFSWTTDPITLTRSSVGAFWGSSVFDYWNGQIKEVRTYNRALSAAEIETLYKSRIGEGNPVSSGLVGYWPLNDNSGNLASATFVDRSGNGNNGTGSDAGGSGGQCSRETFLTSP